MIKNLPILLFILTAFVFVQCKNEPLQTNPEITTLSDFQSEDGKIDLNISGGKMPYQITWSNYESDSLLENLSAGIYYVTISDAKSKVFVDTIQVTEPAWPVCIDAAGNDYKTGIIGDQVWMLENLRISVNSSGDTISSLVYGNDLANELSYGRLYTWSDAMAGSTEESNQGICPDGWHMPSDEDWNILIDNISNEDKNIPDIKNALELTYGGFHNDQFHNLDMSVSFWTSTQARDNAWKRYFNKNLSKAFRYHEKQSNAISVRCIKNN